MSVKLPNFQDNFAFNFCFIWSLYFQLYITWNNISKGVRVFGFVAKHMLLLKRAFYTGNAHFYPYRVIVGV